MMVVMMVMMAVQIVAVPVLDIPRISIVPDRCSGNGIAQMPRERLGRACDCADGSCAVRHCGTAQTYCSGRLNGAARLPFQSQEKISGTL